MLNLRTLPLFVALPALIACGGSDAPAPAATPEPVAEPAPEAPAPPPEDAGQADPTSHYSVVLDPAASKVEWTSIKNGDAPVKGAFTQVTGGLHVPEGDLSGMTGDFSVDLNGIDSGLELRDTRVSEVFFESAPDAAKRAEITLKKLTPAEASIPAGGSTTATADLQLKIGAGTQDLTANVTVARVGESGWTVATTAPIKVSIEGLGLSAPLKALMTLCAHKTVDDIVAIDLDTTFKAKE